MAFELINSRLCSKNGISQIIISHIAYEKLCGRIFATFVRKNFNKMFLASVSLQLFDSVGKSRDC